MPEQSTHFTPEETINNGLGVLIHEKTLFHGSSVKGISTFNSAEEATVGNGLYLTSKPEDARGYARRRSKISGEPILYESQIKNMRFLDLRKESNVAEILKGFLEKLKIIAKKPNLKWYYLASLNGAIEKIEKNEIDHMNLREVTSAHGGLFSEYVQSLGYDGLIALEGGEGEDIGNHDSYLIFDPQKVTITTSQAIS